MECKYCQYYKECSDEELEYHLYYGNEMCFVQREVSNYREPTKREIREEFIAEQKLRSLGIV